MNWQKSLKGKLKINESLAGHTSFKIGGPVQFWVEPRDLSDLQNLVNLAGKKRIPLRIIGAGSNILVDDRGIKGMVVKLNSPYFKRIVVCPAPSYLKPTLPHRRGGVNQQFISAGAGLSLNRLLRYAKEFGLSGLELLAGIPGTVGGALIMNAGDIGDRVLDITVMDRQARVKILEKKDTQFSYRSSNLCHYIVLSAHFKLIKKDKRAIKKKIDEYLDYRQKTQDLSWPSAGCFFKNPSFNKCFGITQHRWKHSELVKRLRVEPESLDLAFAGHDWRDGEFAELQGRISPNSKSAAYFIECCGLKGSSIGYAAVSSKHANFIINKGRATSADILKLMVYITRCVKKRFNLDLEPEIKIWKQI